MDFKRFLSEQKEKHAVLAFGRMNPPTVGHAKLVDKVKDIANEVGGKSFIVLSHTQDAAKNPLSPEQKVKHAQRYFPGVNITTSDKSHPNFLSQASKIYSAGYTHLIMVAGSDRIAEYKTILNKYNGVKGTHGYFKFRDIQVHSAGERDPDAEGVSGMSASKMRGHAEKGNFKEFKKGIPSHVQPEHAKELYNDVRKGMQIKEENEFKESDLSRFSKYIIKATKTEPKIVRKTNPSGRTTDHVEYEVHGTLSSHRKSFKSKKEAEEYFKTVKEEDVNEEFEQLLNEGVHDKAIFKAVFLSGGPGSGKDYVLNNTLAGHGLTEINSDKAFEFLMDKKKLDKKMPDSEKEVRDIERGKAKNMIELRQRFALSGRNGLIINGTGDDPKKYAKLKKELEELGYETSMIAVVTKDEISAQRNIERGQRGGRTVPETTRKEKWDAVNNSRPEMAKLFGQNYIEFDNSEDLRTAPPEVTEVKKKEILQIFKKIQEFIKRPPKNPAASSWVAGELSKKDTLPVPRKGTEKLQPADSSLAQDAQKLGLQYYGFGRYGKNGKVTHHSVHGKLVQDPTHMEQEKSAKKAADIKLAASSGSNTKNKKVTEEFSQSLRKKVKHSDGNTYTAHSDKPRIYVIRNNAAKDAHRLNGEIVQTSNGYMVKLKENADDEINQEFFQEDLPTRIATNEHCGDSSYHTSDNAGTTDSATRIEGKLSFSKLKEQWKKKNS